MKRCVGLGFGILFSLLSLSVWAGDSKIGVVDLQKIMQTSNQMKDIQTKLENDFKPRRDKLVAEEKKLKDEMEKFKRDSAVMSEKKKLEAEKAIIASQQKFEREGQQYQQELSVAHNKAMEDFYNKIKEAIVAVAKSDKFDIVLQKDAAPYSSDKLDITNQVMKKIK